MNYRLPLDLESLRARIRDGQSFTYLPFYGHTAEPGRITNAVYSQFYPVEFQIDGVRYRWAEQWMMAAKARLFGDREALAAILGADEPLACKKIGRTVRNYDDGRWSAARFDLVVAGNIAKFGQNRPLREHLLGSDDAILVEAAPRDAIWGIGLGRDNPAAHDPLRWRGRNLLGFAGKGASCPARRACLAGMLSAARHEMTRASVRLWLERSNTQVCNASNICLPGRRESRPEFS